MTTQSRQSPAMPEIGKAESYYSKLAQQAEAAGDAQARAVAKVGLYLTLALNPEMPWEEKIKYFHHTLRRHCKPPEFADESVAPFYAKLAEFVKQYAGQEALRMASEIDDLFAARMAMGQDRSDIENEAEEFFCRILGQGDVCPEFMNNVDWQQLKLIRDQWI